MLSQLNPRNRSTSTLILVADQEEHNEPSVTEPGTSVMRSLFLLICVSPYFQEIA